MRRFGLALLYSVIADVVATIASYVLIVRLSSNTHDRSIEAAMTSVFIIGPFVAVIAFVVGFLAHGRPRDPEA